MKIPKGQEGLTLIMGNPDRDEMLTYSDSKGNIITKPNVKAGFVSGTDPVGEIYVSGVISNPLFKNIGKYIVNKGKSILSNDYTNRLIKALGTNYRGTSDKVNFANRALYDYLLKHNVDVSKFSNSDLSNLSKLRTNTVTKNLPKGRNATVNNSFITNQYRNDIRLNRGNKEIGYLGTYTDNGKSYVSEIESYAPGVEKRVSEDLYNAAINVAKTQNTSGLVSGEYLNSPEQTYKIWESFNKRLLGNNGVHKFNYGEHVIKSGAERVINNGNVYELLSPTKQIPTKSLNVFHPSTVTKDGKFTVDWNDHNIYKIIPIGLLYDRQDR